MSSKILKSIYNLTIINDHWKLLLTVVKEITFEICSRWLFWSCILMLLRKEGFECPLQTLNWAPRMDSNPSVKSPAFNFILEMRFESLCRGFESFFTLFTCSSKFFIEESNPSCEDSNPSCEDSNPWLQLHLGFESFRRRFESIHLSKPY